MLQEFDHRVLGAKYDLFSFYEEGPGLPVWHEKGLRIKNALIDYWRQLHRRHGYQEIQSPLLLDKALWKKSGHCDYFAENMFFSSVENRDYAIKPMNCPGGILFFNSKKRSHAELPFRLSELGHVHRFENSGSLHGLMRVRSFVQDDAHIFCSKEQLLDEIVGVISLIEKVMQQCGMNRFRFELSVRGAGKEFLGEHEDWQFAEAQLAEALVVKGYQAPVKPGEAKFYGPSLDLHLEDRHGRSWQCSSIQLDFNLPARFNVHYFDKQGERQVPFMLHRAIFGSLERFIGILLEHYGVELPRWMHPVPFKILSLGVDSYARELQEELHQLGLHAEVDLSSDPLKEKLRRSYEEMVGQVLIVGPRELDRGEVGVRGRSGQQQRLSKHEFLAALI